jgi:hypothetical protein
VSFKALDLPPQVRGDTWNFKFVFQDEAGDPIDISSNEYWLTVKEDLDVGDDQAIVQVGPVAPTFTDGTQGILNLTVSALQTADIPAKTMQYDLQEVNNASEVTTILLGRIKVRKDVTLTADYSGGSSTTVSSTSGIALYSGTTNTDQYSGIFLNGQAGNRLILEENSTISFTALIVGKDTVTNESCAFDLNGAVERENNITKVIGSVGKFVLARENPLFDASISADDINEGIQVNVKAATSNPTKWVAKINYTEVFF